MRRLADAVGPFGLLAGGVGADWRALDDRTGVDGEGAGGVDAHGEAVHATRGRATTLLADAIILQTITKTLKPL